MDFIKGEIIAINKPYRMSSFGALAYVRKRLSRRLGVKRVKTGHAGTLDPLATGVLILCTGKKTKEIERLQAHSKEYTATLQLGATTASYDLEHEVNATYPTQHITRQLIDDVLPRFVGDIDQVPPSYCACKINGDRAYELKRKGEEVALKAKRIHIDGIEVTSFDDERMLLQIRVACGKGTYIRALARDIGRALGTGAHLTQLCRTRVGDVTLDQCVELRDVDAWLDSVLPPKTEEHTAQGAGQRDAEDNNTEKNSTDQPIAERIE